MRPHPYPLHGHRRERLHRLLASTAPPLISASPNVAVGDGAVAPSPQRPAPRRPARGQGAARRPARGGGRGGFSRRSPARKGPGDVSGAGGFPQPPSKQRRDQSIPRARSEAWRDGTGRGGARRSCSGTDPAARPAALCRPAAAFGAEAEASAWPCAELPREGNVDLNSFPPHPCRQFLGGFSVSG